MTARRPEQQVAVPTVTILVLGGCTYRRGLEGARPLALLSLLQT